MAFARAPATSLALYGGPGQPLTPVTEAQTVTDTVSVAVTDVSSLLIQAAITVSDTVSVSISDSSAVLKVEVNAYVTELGVLGGPRTYQVLAPASVASLFALSASDTLSVQLLEDPVDEQEIVTSDIVRIGISDTRSLFNNLGTFDALSVSMSETVALLIAGVTLKSVTDTLSVSLTESRALNVTLDTADTLSVAITDTSAVTTPTNAIAVTDTLSVSVSEDALLQVFAGAAEVNVGDTLVVTLADAVIVVRTTPTDTTFPVRCIRFELRCPSMRFEFL